MMAYFINNLIWMIPHDSFVEMEVSQPQITEAEESREQTTLRIREHSTDRQNNLPNANHKR